ncbi:hypothetical protein ACWDTI_01095 [Gordonia sp. NPDC003424]
MAGPHERHTISARLRAARRHAPVGRDRELARIATFLDDPDGAVVMFVHGPGGVGKSCLLDAVEQLVVDRDRPCIRLDGADTPADRAGFAAALRIAASAGDDGPPAEALTPDAVLVIDTAETLRPLERWMRDDLIAHLSDRNRVILAGRHPPSNEWRTDPGWRDLLTVLSLRNLRPEDATALLLGRGVPPISVPDLVAETHGHPLALVIAVDHYGADGRDSGAATGVTAPDRTRAEAAASSMLRDCPDAATRLLGRFVDDVDRPAHREALHVCGHARRVDRAMLRHVLDVDDTTADDVLAWLRERPYAVSHPDGLSVHDIVADALDADLRWRDQESFTHLHQRIRTVIVDRMHRLDGVELQRATADLLYLHRGNPAAASLYSFEELGSMSTHPYRPADADDLRAIMLTSEGPARTATAAFWAERSPDSVHMILDSDEKSCGAAVFAWDPHHAGDLGPDRATATVLEMLADRRPPEPGERVLHEFIADSHDLDGLGPVSDMVAGLSLREWMAPGLGWVAVSSTHGPKWIPVWDYIGFEPLGRLTQSDGTTLTVYARDFLRSPYDEWLQSLAAVEMGNAPAAQRTMSPVALSRTDFGTAVRTMLRDLHRPDRLAAGPLAGSRLAAPPGCAPPAPSPAAAAARLAEVTRAALDVVAADPALDRAARALHRTYVQPATTQERAAEVLGMPFSTYRRHLAAGTERLTEVLWKWELHGVADTSGDGRPADGQ